MRLIGFKRLALGLTCAVTMTQAVQAATTFALSFRGDFREPFQVVQSPLGLTRNFAAGTSPNTAAATLRADFTGLGLYARGERSTAYARTALFADVNFVAAPAAGGAFNTTNLRFSATGNWTGTVELETVFSNGPIAAGQSAQESSARIRSFSQADQVDVFGAGTSVAQQILVGPFSRQIDFNALPVNSGPNPNPGDVFICGPNATNQRCRAARAANLRHCPRGPCLVEVVDPLRLTRFGFGLAFEGTVAAELLLSGEVNSLNSFDFLGLEAFDASTGERVDGTFFTDDGIDLTRGATFNTSLTAAPVPLPASLPALAVGIAGLFALRRAKA